MKIFLIGATGTIGARLLSEAVSRGHEVIAGARDLNKINANSRVTPVRIDLNDAREMSGIAQSADVIVSALSPREGSDAVADATSKGDAVMEVARRAEKRLVMVGGAGTLNLPDGSPVLPHVPEAYRAEAAGMKAVYSALSRSDLDWTFFAPAALTLPGTRTGVFRLGKEVIVQDAEGNSNISAEDYAVAMVDELETPAHRRSIMTIGY